MRKKIMVAVLMIQASFCFLCAQDNLGQIESDQHIPHPGRRPPPPPIIAALDLNRDGTIDANEIAQSAESLKKLDNNGDGILTQDELHPPRPESAPCLDEKPQGPPPQF